MGFYGPIAAAGGNAKYDPLINVLNVTVYGEVREYVNGFNLQVVNAEELVYQICGWSGPIGQGMQPYTHSQSFTTTAPLGQSHLTVTVLRTNGTPLVFVVDTLSGSNQSSSNFQQPSAFAASNINASNRTVLVAASTLKATYHRDTQKLSLYAAGQASYRINDITFRRSPHFVGGLQYRLEGTVASGVSQGHEVPYMAVNEFDMELPNRAMPSNTVIIITENGQKTLDIEFIGLPPNPSSGYQASNGSMSNVRLNSSGNQVLAPAYQLSADYDYKTQELTLHAAGIMPNTMENIVFERQEWLGGLKFKLLGTQNGVPTFWPPYNHSQSFTVHVPRLGLENVIIETAGPKTNYVPVHTLIHVSQSSANRLSQNSSFQVQPQIQAMEANNSGSNENRDKQLNILYKMPFEISWTCNVPSQGTVDISFDTNYLQLQSSSIRGNQIVWTLNSMNMGNTQITVKETGGVAQYITGQTWNAFIHLPGIGMANPSADSLQQQSNGTAQQSNGMAQQSNGMSQQSNGMAQQSNGMAQRYDQHDQSFISNVTKGLDIIKAKYPNAGLLTVELDTNPFLMFPNPVMKITAEVNINQKTQIATIISRAALSSWGEILISEQPAIIENIVMQWPVKMDLDEATQLVKKAGYTFAITEVTLRQPLQLVVGPQQSEPLYIFNETVGQEGDLVIVGVVTKKVSGPPLNNDSVYRSISSPGQAMNGVAKNKIIMRTIRNRPSNGFQAGAAIAAH